MLKLFNAGLVVAVLAASFHLYWQEHANRALDRNIAKLERQTREERERLRPLQAEWANLTRPERLQQIAQDQLYFQSLKPQQFVPLAELAQRLPALTEGQGGNAISALLAKLR